MVLTTRLDKLERLLELGGDRPLVLDPHILRSCCLFEPEGIYDGFGADLHAATEFYVKARALIEGRTTYGCKEFDESIRWHVARYGMPIKSTLGNQARFKGLRDVVNTWMEAKRAIIDATYDPTQMKGYDVIATDLRPKIKINTLGFLKNISEGTFCCGASIATLHDKGAAILTTDGSVAAFFANNFGEAWMPREKLTVLLLHHKNYAIDRVN